MGIIVAVLIPALVLVGALFAFIRSKSDKGSAELDSSKSSWRFSERSPFTSRQPTPSRPQSSVLSESSSSLGGSDPKKPGHKKRKYDAVYRTHEPLPGKPDIDFEDKVWDLNLQEDSPTISTSSSSRKPPSTLATASPSPLGPIPQSARTSDL